MGNPFSSKTRTYVSASVVPLIEDDKYLPDAMRQAVIRSVFNDKSVGENITRSVLNSPLQRFEKAYKFGKNGYHYGLPDITTNIRIQGKDQVKAAIEAETGETITLEYLEYGPLNHVHYGWYQLDQLGHDPETNQIASLTATKGSSVYLDDIIPIYRVSTDEDPVSGYWVEFDKSGADGETPTRSDIADQLGTTEARHIRAKWIDSTVEDGVRIFYVWDDNGELQEEYVDYVVPVSNNGYFMAKYSYIDGADTIFRHWFYEDGLGTYPALDGLYDASYINPGDFFPFVPFRKDFVDMTDVSQESTQAYIDSKKMAGLFGLDYKSIGEEINQSPDIGNVIDATFLMGVPTLNPSEVETKYLYEFFLRWWIRDVQDVVGINDLAGVVTNNANIYARIKGNRYATTFSDAGTEFVLGCADIIRKTKIGNTLSVGATELELVQEDFEYEVRVRGRKSDDWEYTVETRTETLYNIVLRKQVTPNTYDEITVISPIMEYSVISSYTVAAKANQDTFFVPLDRSISKTFPRDEREELYFRSCRFLFTARKEVKEKWYQTGAFRLVVTFAAIVFTVITAGSGSGVAASVVAALGISVSIGLIILMELVLSFLVLPKLFELVAAELGTEIAIALAIFVAAYAINNWDSLGFTTAFGKGSHAMNLLAVSNGLVNATQVNTMREFEKLMGEYEAFEQLQEEKLEELETAQSLLDSESLLDPLLFVNRQEPKVLWGESPEAFYNRTIHSGNIGTKGIESIENFVDMAVNLPTVQQTLGGLNGV